MTDCFIYYSYSPLGGTLRNMRMRPRVAVLLSPALWHGLSHHHTSAQWGPALHSLCTPALHTSTAFAREDAFLRSSNIQCPRWKECVSTESHSPVIQVWENQALWWSREVALKTLLLNPAPQEQESEIAGKTRVWWKRVGKWSMKCFRHMKGEGCYS